MFKRTSTVLSFAYKSQILTNGQDIEYCLDFKYCDSKIDPYHAIFMNVSVLYAICTWNELHLHNTFAQWIS